MGQPQQEPPVAAQDPASAQLNEAYRRGYLDGHLAGWRDAVAREGKQGPGPMLAPPSPPMHPQTPWPGQMTTQAIPAYGRQDRPFGAPLPPLDPQVQAARKAKRETQNINITLYIASLFMVAAAALFVVSSLPVPARLVGVWLGTAVFYGAGLILHAATPRLRPAALAFVGTALAIVPFAGLATYNLGFPNAPAVWLLTSLVGTAAYVVAAVRLGSRLVVYLSLAFLISTAWSSGAVLGAALSWYFTALIVIAAVLSLAGRVLGNRIASQAPVLGLFAKPLSDLGPWFAPVGLVSSLAFPLGLNAADHAMVLLAGTLFYGVMGWVDPPRLRRANYLGLRLSLTIAAPFVGWLMGESLAFAAGAMTLTLAVQTLIVACFHRRIGRWLGRAVWPVGDVFLSLPLTAGLSLLWSAGIAVSGHDGGAWVWSPALPLLVGLLAAMAAVPAMLPRGEWLPLPALGAAVLASGWLAAQDWAMVLAAALSYAVVRFLSSKERRIKGVMLVAARIVLTGLAASLLAAYLPAQSGKAEVIIAVVVVMAAGQLLADTLLGMLGRPNKVTAVSGTSWAVLGTVLIVAQAVAFSARDQAASEPTVPVAATAFLIAVLAMGAAACAHSWVFLPRDQRYAGAELMAPAFLAVAGICAGVVFGASGTVVGAASLTLFLAVTGWRLRAQPEPTHRWIYWWCARGSSLLLAMAVFVLWREHIPADVSADVSLGLVVLFVLGGQLLILAGSMWRGNTVAGFSFDVCATVAATLLLATFQMIANPEGQWTQTLVVALVVASLGLVGCAYALRSPAPGVVQWAAPLAMAAIAGMALPHRLSFEVAAALVVVTAGVCAVRGLRHRSRSAYFLLARIASTALIAVLVTEVTGSPTIQTVVLSGVLLAQLGVQWLAGSPAARRIVGESLVWEVSLWLLLLAQVMAPVAYVIAAGGLDRQGSGLRWVVALELLLLAASAILAQSALGQRGASYLAILAVAGGAAIVAPVLPPGITTLVLIVISMAVNVWGCLFRAQRSEMRWYGPAAAAAFLFAAVLVDGAAPAGTVAIMWLVAGLAFIAAAHLQRLPWLTLPGALMVLVAAVLVRAQILEWGHLAGIAALSAFGVVVGSLYLVRMLLWELASVVPVQRWSLVGVALVSGAAFSLLAMADHDAILGGALAFTAVAALACVETPGHRRPNAIDLAVVATALIWFIASSAYVDLGMFWFVEWCALALGVLAVRRHISQLPQKCKALLVAAGSVASLGAVLTMFGGDTLQQAVSLLLFVALLVAGLSIDERMFTIWGAIGVSASVLWYWRGFTFVLLAVLALLLIGLAIWRLNRKPPHNGDDGGSPSVRPAPATTAATPVAPGPPH